VLGRLVEFIGAHEIGASGVDDLRQILQFSKASGVDERIKLDPTLARGLAYYTGAIIEMNVADLAGSLGGGGRYDNLVGMFLGKDVPACGFSLGLERIIVVMSEREMFPAALVSSPADVMVTTWNEDSIGDSIALATELRSKGLRVDLYPETDKMAKQFKYASSRGIPFVLILGDEERAANEISIKDLRTGEQLRLPFAIEKTLPAELMNEDRSKWKRHRENLFRWLNEGKVGEADDSIKPGA
jgi:histidyl-tRNA synthetase